MRKGALVLLALAGLAGGCASTQGDPWTSLKAGMSPEEMYSLGGKVCSVARGENGAIVHNYTDGGSVLTARAQSGEWRVVSWHQP